MSKHMTIINLACTITKLRKWGEAWKHSAESAQNAASQLTAEHERKLAEHRAAFGARTEADRKIIEGLRTAADEQVLSASEVASVLGCAGETPVQAAKRVVKERNGLLTQVQDQRAEIERLRNDERKAYQDGDALRVERDALRAEVAALQERLRASIARGDFAEIEVARLKAQTPKRSHPVKAGEWVRKHLGVSQGLVAQVAEVRSDKSYRLSNNNVWSWGLCEPCDPPADHDTPAGKEAAEAVVRDFRSGDSEVSITGLFDDTKITVRREPDQNHGSRIVISDANDMGEANIYLTESGARQMATALIGLCDVRKVPQ